VAALASAVFVTISAGCSGDGSKVALPYKTTSAPVRRASAPPSAKDAVKAAYTTFWDASDRALAGPPEQIRSSLRDYSTGSYLDFQVRELVLQQAEHKGPWGKVVLHIRNIRIKGAKATVRDCQDASHAGLADTRTHKLIPGTRGTKGRNLQAQLTQGGDGRWRISDLRQFPTAC